MSLKSENSMIGMAIQKNCPSCQRVTTVNTRDGVADTNQRCQHCGFRLPDEANRPKLKSSDFGV
jgi:transposase-like protein